MRRFRRRDLLFAGAAVCCISEASDALGQGAKDSPVSGRIGGKKVDALKALCYLKGERGKAELAKIEDSEFVFDKVPPGAVLTLKLVYNGHTYRYPILDRHERSRLEILLPEYAGVASYSEKDLEAMSFDTVVKMFRVEAINDLRARLCRKTGLPMEGRFRAKHVLRTTPCQGRPDYDSSQTDR